MKHTPNEIHWFGRTITREYNLIVFDKNQKPLPNQTVVLLNTNGEQIWEKNTDQNGIVYFNLTFNKENYENKFLLQTTVNNQEISKEISFFTNTPIILSAEETREKKIGDTQTFCLLLLIIISLFLLHRPKIKK